MKLLEHVASSCGRLQKINIYIVVAEAYNIEHPEGVGHFALVQGREISGANEYEEYVCETSQMH
jgi:hypothetical protein